MLFLGNSILELLTRKAISVKQRISFLKVAGMQEMKHSENWRNGATGHPREAQPSPEIHKGTFEPGGGKHLCSYVWKNERYLCLIKNKEENGM